MTSYFGRPLLKGPVWTWEVPTYFFVGGAAGAAAMIAALASWFGADPELARHARWIALAGALLSPPLLISDLGRPSRFIYMLRVFKKQSAMSVGVWTLVAFTNAVLVAVILTEWQRAGGPGPWLNWATRAADGAAAVTGLVLATYTGVLIGATAIPVWARHVRMLPIHFGLSALGAAVSLVELAGHRTHEMNLMGIGAAAVETVIWIGVETQKHDDSRLLRSGVVGRIVRLGSLCSGPLPLVARLTAATLAPVRIAVALITLAGSVLTRFGWIAAGRASAEDPTAAMGGTA